MSKLSRRNFLGSSTALAGAGIAGSILPLSNAIASSSVRPKIAPAYGPASGIAKLNANENPYGPSKPALEAMMKSATQGAY
jgi:histidinol-phosphate aminotransferase